MADTSRQSAKRRASFARAERIKRTGGAANAARQNQRQPARPAIRAAFALAAKNSPARSMKATRRPTSIEQAAKRTQQARQAIDQRQHRQLKEQTRQTSTRLAERRRDIEQRAAFSKRREIMQANLKRARDLRQRTEQRQRQQLAQQTRQTFNRHAENRKLTEQSQAEARSAAYAKEALRKAGTAIDREQKQRQNDQQAAHRWHTGQVRTRHQAETRSLRASETIVLERHWHAIRRLEAAEQRELKAFDTRRSSLGNRIVERVAGRQKGDEQRQHLQQRYDNERMAQHRQLEVTKQRQFQTAQNVRLQQARERLMVFTGHRAERQQLHEQQQQNRPRLIEERQRTMIEVERQRTLEHERTNDRQHTEDRSWHIPARVH